jgi:putative ABC transport system permease protein
MATVVGPVVAYMFAISPSRPFTVHSEEVIRSGTAGFVLAGVVMALSLVWAAGANLDVLLAPLRWLARPFGSLAPATRLAVAYPLTHPFRTGLTAAMFALVFLTMVSATTLLRSTEVAYVKRDGGAGFDIRAQFSSPPTDFAAALSGSDAVRRDDFTAIGAQSTSAIEVLWPSEQIALWRPMDLRAADGALLSASSGELIARATGYTSDAAVWRTLGGGAPVAILSRRDADSLPDLRAALTRGGATEGKFPPPSVWVRDPRGGASRKLTVIGVAADSSILPRGLLTSQATLTGIPAGEQSPSEFFLKARADVALRTAATGIPLTFPNSGVRTRILGDEARTGHAVRGLLDSLIRGFLGMGFASGIAALGVIGMRSVAERRQQIGMLRALGLSRRAVQTTFLLEGSVVAVLGITVGAVVGLVLARNVVAFLARDFTQLTLIVPWWQVLTLAGAAYSAALISALAVAWQAGRVAPAEALRYE